MTSICTRLGAFVCLILFTCICRTLGVALSSTRTTYDSYSVGAYFTTTGDIPGIWRSYCPFNTAPPCTAFCDPRNQVCLQSARSIVRTCGPLWTSYSEIQNGFKPPGPGWYNHTSVYGSNGGPRKTTVDIYTTFSTAKSEVVRWLPNHNSVTTSTPVYALGTPTQLITTTIIPTQNHKSTITILTGPTPHCKWQTFDIETSTDCGECTISGGTVDFYFWPPETTGSISERVPTTAAPQAQSTVFNGTTLYSPTVYISLRTIFASDTCLQIGARHTGTLIALDPLQVSTQIDIGMKQTAYRYGQLNYTALLQPPPQHQYEVQPSCIFLGCPTIYSTLWFPTLMVPPQVRSIDPAWKSCALALEGLYVPLP
jgi:hypothetical protein